MRFHPLQITPHLLHCVKSNLEICQVLWLFEFSSSCNDTDRSYAADYSHFCPHGAALELVVEWDSDEYQWETLEGSITLFLDTVCNVTLTFKSVQATNTWWHVSVLYIMQKKQSRLPLFQTVYGRTLDGKQGLKWERIIPWLFTWHSMFICSETYNFSLWHNV